MPIRLPARSRKAQSRITYGCSVGSWTTSVSPACRLSKALSRSVVARLMLASVQFALISAVENFAQLACECLRLAGVAVLAAHEAAMVAGEHGRLLPEQLGGGDGGASGEGAQRLLTHGDHDACPCRGQCVDVRTIAGDR